jgi:hypothetical protein
MLDFIILERHDLRSLIDAHTIQQLETLAPGLSSADQDTVVRAMQEGLLFPLISDDSVRGQILDRLTTMPEPIYSLRTYLQETKLLQLGLAPLRLLLPKLPRNQCNTTIRALLRGAHERVRADSTIAIQVAEDQFVTRPCPADAVFPLKFCQLFLFCLRNFHSLTGTPPRKDRGKNKSYTASESFETSLWKLAKLARRLGFVTAEIEELRQRSPESQITMDFLLQQWPSDRYNCSAEQRHRLASSICAEMASYRGTQAVAMSPMYTTDLVQQPKSKRYGRPLDSEHASIRDYLFAEPIYFTDPFKDPPGRLAKFLTPLALRRFTIIAFFGDLSLESLDRHGGPRPPRPDPPRPDPPRPDPPRPDPPRPDPPRPDPPRPDPPPHGPNPPSQETLHSQPNGAFEAIPSEMTPSSFVRTHLQSVNAERVVLYLNDERHYTLFSKDESGRRDFNDCVQGLADRDYCFFVLSTSSKVRYTHIQALWHSAQDFSIVIAVLKRVPEQGKTFPFSGRSLAGLLSTMDAHASTSRNVS